MLNFGGLSSILRSSFGHPSAKFREILLIFASALLPKNLNYVLIMGKLFHGPLGRVKGSVGNVTYRRIYGVANASAMYDKVLEVANPKTANQIIQRAKMQPAQKFYEAYKSVLNHCLQGRQPGEITRRAWMSMHMNSSFRRNMYVPKGWEGVVASPYVVSKGVLPTVGPAIFEDEGTEYDVPTFGLEFTKLGKEDRSVDVLSAALLAANPDRLQVGDELTFLFLVTDDYTGPEAYPLVVSFVLDPNGGGEVPLRMGGNEYGGMWAQPLALDPDTFICVAAACIHSRKVGDKWQYSSEEMSLLVDYSVAWSNSKAYNQMMASYGAEGYNSTNGRRVLHQATNQPYNGHIATLTHLDSGRKITYLASVRENVEASKYADNIIGVFTSDGKASGNLIDQNGKPITTKPAEGEPKPVTPAQVGWTGQTIMWWNEYLPQVSGRK